MTSTELTLKSGIKRRQMEEALKEHILSGHYQPGQRLPSYEDILGSFEISRATFHQVLKRLKEDFYINSIERQGVFVAANPPCWYRVGLVFESYEQDNLFSRKMAHESVLLTQKSCYDFPIFRGCGAGNSGVTMLGELRNQLERQTLAGLCFTYDPVDPLLLDLLDRHPEVPMLLLDRYPNHPTSLVLQLASETCAEKAADSFLADRRQRVAVLSMENQPLMMHFLACARERGLTVPTEWVLPVPRQSLYAAERIIQVLLSLPAERRPDGLYLTDDNLLVSAQSGLVKAGVRVPEDVLVLSHDNFPDPDATILPIGKIGFDVREILSQGAEMIKSARQGRRPEARKLAGKYDHEMAAAPRRIRG